MSSVKFFINLVGWLIIVFGITVIFAGIAYIIYSKWPTNTGRNISIFVIAMGFSIAAIIATKIWRRHGTMDWLSGIRRIS